MSEHAPHDHAHGDDGHHGVHVHEPMHYVKVFGALVVLFFISVTGPIVGEVTGLKIITLITAFGIAVVKAGLVVKYFMHLTVEKTFVHWILVTALAFMFLFFFAVSPDVLNHKGSNWVNVAAEAEVERGLAQMAAGGGHGGGHEEEGAGHDAKAGEHGGH